MPHRPSQARPCGDSLPIRPRRPRLASWLLLLGASGGLVPGALGSPPAPSQDTEEELVRLLAEERVEADRLRRVGEYGEARGLLSEHLRDDETDAASRALLGRVYLDEGRRLDRAERHLVQALEEARDPGVRRGAAVDLLRLLHRLGRDREARAEVLPAALEGEGESDPEALFRAAAVLRAVGERAEAERLLRRGARAGSTTSWRDLLGRGRCLQRLGDLEAAASELLEADRLTHAGGGRGEAEVLVALGSLVFEADREVADAEGRSAAKLLDEALRLNPASEGALLAMYELHRVNWMRQRRDEGEFLERMIELRPDSVDAHLVAAGAALRIGKLPAVRSELERLEDTAPGRREVRTLRAALCWVEHDRERAEAILDELLAIDPLDSGPEREVGHHLLDLYRFAEARPFLERAVERDPSDHRAWIHLGHALANTGDEAAALEALRRSREAGGLRQDAWRKNMTMVLERLEREYTTDDFGDLSFAWKPDAEAVLSVYLEPFYREVRAELAERYGFTPAPTHIEVFRRHQDFSVRSTGFEGFPALGVCFGPVVTALSPNSELRGTFSWARTSFHEFTHVIHLGLSHNRCPRWITEGLATWEEAQRNPAWQRNMRRDLVDARANGRIIPVRDLNAAFRGPRILFGYYQGGLVCELLIGRYGFPPIVRLLEAFDEGLDLDQALDRVYGISPEELDAALLELVDGKVADLAIEPRWEPEVLLRRRLSLGPEPPDGADAEALREWQEAWLDQAWGAFQTDRAVDAAEFLRRARSAGQEPPRALFLRGAISWKEGDRDTARALYLEALEAGSESFGARMALGAWHAGRGEYAQAEEHYLAAEAAFPGFDEESLAAELALAGVLIAHDQEDEAMRAAERYLRYEAGNYPWRMRVARWHLTAERFEEAAFLFNEANEIDPFSRELHLLWAQSLEGAGRHEEALREWRVAAIVPVELDLGATSAATPEERASWLAGEVRALVALGRLQEAREALGRARELAPEADGVAAAGEALAAAGG